MVNDYTIYDKIGRASKDRAFRLLYRSRSSSRFLTMSEVDFWCIHAWGKQTREMESALSKCDQS